MHHRSENPGYYRAPPYLGKREHLCAHSHRSLQQVGRNGTYAKSRGTTVAKILVDKVICVHGCPKQILTDQSPNFESQLFARCIAVRSVPESMPGRSTTSNQEQYSRDSYILGLSRYNCIIFVWFRYCVVFIPWFGAIFGYLFCVYSELRIVVSKFPL